MCIRESRRLVFLLAALCLAAVFAARPAEAVPSFARQTGLSCTTCHTMFPELKPFGRMFKLTGYTMNKNGAKHPSYPPLAAMAQISFTHTQAAQDPNGLPSGIYSLHYMDHGNDAIGSPQQFSIFYGGQIYGHVGALIQATYADDSNVMGVDMSDIRYANTTKFCGKSLIYGLTFNNNPTDEDVWNSTPAWGYPFADSNIAPGPAADVMLDNQLGGFIGGAGGYFYWNKTLYIAGAVYRTALNGITSPFGWGNHPFDYYTSGAIPYWRVALTHQWGPSYFEIGTYGLSTDIFATGDSGPKNNFRDVAVDAQYQYIQNNQSFTMETTWIHEDENYAPGVSTNKYDHLNVFRINGDYYRMTSCGELGGTVGYFSTTGSSDPAYYGYAGGDPATSGEVFELDYMPPWHDYGPGGFGFSKFSLQYVLYNKFNGTSVGASDNNTLYLLAWFMF